MQFKCNEEKASFLNVNLNFKGVFRFLLIFSDFHENIEDTLGFVIFTGRIPAFPLRNIYVV